MGLLNVYCGGHNLNISTGEAGLIVKPDIAGMQIESETIAQKATADLPGSNQTGTGPSPTLAKSESAGQTQVPPPARKLPKRFHGTVELDSSRVGRDASRIAEELISHLVAQTGSKVRVTLEIEGELPNGADEQLVRIVTENGRALKFYTHGFEAE